MWGKQKGPKIEKEKEGKEKVGERARARVKEGDEIIDRAEEEW